MLTRDQLDTYHRDGFLHLRGQIEPALVAQLATWAEELRVAEAHPGGVRKYSDDAARELGEVILSRIEYFYPFHAGLRGLLESALLLGPASEVLGEDAVLFKDKINYKLPGTAGFALHQDVQAGWRKYASDFVSVIVGLDAPHQRAAPRAASDLQSTLPGRPLPALLRRQAG